MSNRLRIRRKSSTNIGSFTATPKLLDPLKYEGAFFYKYRTVERLDWLKEILLDDTLYFPTAAQLNDPAEARPRLVASSPKALARVLTALYIQEKPDLTSQERDDVMTYYRSWDPDELLAACRASLHEQLKRFRIYSLGKRWDCEHLWKEYAGDHRGYCLEFRNDPSYSWKAYEVRYDDVVFDLSRPDSFNANFLFYKNKPWSKEEEVRLLGMRDSDDRLNFDPSLLTRVILGRNIQPNDATTIREMAGRRNLPLIVVSENHL